MTPGWTNVRNQLAETHDERPQGMVNVRMRTWIASAILALLLWLLLAACVAYAPNSLLRVFP